MSDLGTRVSCVGSFGHPNSTRLAAIGVLVRNAVCSRSDPRKLERPPTAWANWLKYWVASHLHQLSYANIKTLMRRQLSVAARRSRSQLTASRTGGIAHAALISG